MSSSQFTSRALALSARTIHLKLFPTPKNFNEQREVLRVLERFGEVTMFKSLKYRTDAPAANAFLAIFATEHSVKQVLEATPIRYRLVPNVVAPTAEDHQSHQHMETEGGIPNTATEENAGSPTATKADDSSAFPTSQSQAQPSKHSEFELQARPSTLDHEKYITSPHTNPLYGPYSPLPAKRSQIANMLSSSIPSSMWARGLRDWETDFERWRMDSGQGVQDGESEKGLRGKVLGKVGGLKEGMAEEGRVLVDELGKGSVERAVYHRMVNRRKKAVPEIMWGIRRFKDMNEQREVDGSVD